MTASIQAGTTGSLTSGTTNFSSSISLSEYTLEFSRTTDTELLFDTTNAYKIAAFGPYAWRGTFSGLLDTTQPFPVSTTLTPADPTPATIVLYVRTSSGSDVRLWAGGVGAAGTGDPNCFITGLNVGPIEPGKFARANGTFEIAGKVVSDAIG